MEDPSPLPDYFRDLQSQSPPETVVAFIQANPGHPVIKPTRDALGGLSRPDHSSLTQQLLGTINDDVWKRQFFHAIELHIENHPLETAFIVVMIAMLCNPISVPDLKPPNSTTKSIAEAWKSRPGGPEAADSAFDILRGIGMVGPGAAIVRSLRHDQSSAMLSVILNMYPSISAMFRGCNNLSTSISRLLGNFNELMGELATSASELLPILQQVVDKVISTVKDPEFYRAVFYAIINHVKEHPYQTAFIIIALVLILNPIGLAGFGALGPVAGSAAAAWQATYGGYVVAGSLFSVLQMLGMVGAVAIPMSGVGLGGAVLAYPWLKRWIEGSEMPAAMMRRLQDVNMTMPDMSGWWEKTIKRLRWL